MKHLVGQTQTKEVDFAGDKVSIKKLTVGEVKKIQEIMKKTSKKADSELDVLRAVLRISVFGADTLTDNDFDTFSPVDLASLSEDVMSFAGLGDKSDTSGN